METFIFVIIVLVFILILWFQVSGFGCQAAKAMDPDTLYETSIYKYAKPNKSRLKTAPTFNNSAINLESFFGDLTGRFFGRRRR